MGQTNLTQFLNAQIDWSRDTTKVYTVGKGIMIRSPFDGFEDDEAKIVVPGTFWVNDIFSPSQIYPGSGPTDGNPWCPTQDAPWSCDQDGDTGDDGPWHYAQLAAVIGRNMHKLFHDFDNIQEEDWGWGVFYASDSNSVDKRCHWREKDGRYDCPGGWLSVDGVFTPRGDRHGAGGYPAGNPKAVNSDGTTGGGGGAGCHFNDGGKWIDQTDAFNSDNENLMNGYDCEANYHFNDDWGAWVNNWRYNGLSGASSASWALDLASVWVNNLRDMIKIQNQLWFSRRDWNNRRVPQVDYSTTEAWKNRPYWGWNEIPVSREVIRNIDNWDAIMIKLPAHACLRDDKGLSDALGCYDPRYHKSIEQSLQNFVNSGYLGLGADAASPSSSVVLAREYMDDSGNYFREFFCESWESPNSLYKIVFEPDGKCYLDHASPDPERTVQIV